ncbi:hypothetical protein GCM10022388_11890 [Flavobacterium chungnamense]|uniref:Uncharacterized protein n=2 Tax=Flavobacterium chungnamense TaxID=706182 RepID=A0ABP7UMY8_9FLAO
MGFLNLVTINVWGQTVALNFEKSKISNTRQTDKSNAISYPFVGTNYARTGGTTTAAPIVLTATSQTENTQKAILTIKKYFLC